MIKTTDQRYSDWLKDGRTKTLDSDQLYEQFLRVEVRELRAALQSQVQQSQWISVEERLPDGDRFVDVYIRSRRNPNFGERKVSVLFTNGSFKFEHMFDYEYVSHWMPIPPAPEGTLTTNNEGN